jgi:hypothetical protein
MANTYFQNRLAELTTFEVRAHGGKGLVGLTVPANKDLSHEQIAEDAVMIHESFLAGNYTDITDQRL